MLAAILICACFIARASASSSSITFYEELRIGDEISHRKLVEELNKPIDIVVRHWGQTHFFSTAPLLARTSDKDTPLAALGGMSINELLALNTCRLENCAKDDLEHRRLLRDKFAKAKEEVEKSASPLDGGMERLEDYCQYVYKGCYNFCQREREQIIKPLVSKLGLEDKLRLKLFRRSINGKYDPESRYSSLSDTIERYVRQHKFSVPDYLMGSCKRLMEIVEQVYQFQDKSQGSLSIRRSGWEMAYVYCESLVSIVEKQEQSQ